MPRWFVRCINGEWLHVLETVNFPHISLSQPFDHNMTILIMHRNAVVRGFIRCAFRQVESLTRQLIHCVIHRADIAGLHITHTLRWPLQAEGNKSSKGTKNDVRWKSIRDSNGHCKRWAWKQTKGEQTIKLERASVTAHMQPCSNVKEAESKLTSHCPFCWFPLSVKLSKSRSLRQV